MNDDYLWDASGSLDPDVAHFEHWAGTFGHGAVAGATRVVPLHHAPPRRAPRVASGLLWACAAALFLVWLGLWGPKVPRPSTAAPRPTMTPAVVEQDDGDTAEVIAPPTLPPDRRQHVVQPEPKPKPESKSSRAPKITAGSPSTPEAQDSPYDGLTDADGQESRQQLAAHSTEIVACFRDHAPTNPKGGLVAFDLEVDHDGTVTRSTFVRDNFIDDAEGKATGRCIANVMKRFRFSSSDRRRTLPFVLFHPGSE